MIDDHNRCEWANVSSGLAHSGLDSPDKGPYRKTVIVVVVNC